MFGLNSQKVLVVTEKPVGSLALFIFYSLPLRLDVNDTVFLP